MFIVSTPDLGAKEKHVANAMKLMDGDRVQHYWDPGRMVGTEVRRFVPELENPAWDFWMVYGPEAEWAEELPEPSWWEHQLGQLGRSYPDRRLEPDRLVAKIDELDTTG